LPNFLFNILVNNYASTKKLIVNKNTSTTTNKNEKNINNKCKKVNDHKEEINDNKNDEDINDIYVTNSPKNNEKNNKKNKKPNVNNNFPSDILFYDKDARISRYIDCLTVKTLTDYNDWFSVACISFNEGASLDTFKKHSSKCENYSEKACETLWESINPDNEIKAGILRLFELCKRDNYPLFLKTLQKDKIYIINNIFTSGISDLYAALLFYSLKPDLYIYDGDNRELYRANKYGIWKKDSGCLYLHNDINYIILDEIEKYYYAYKYSLPENIDDYTDEQKDQLKKWSNVLNKSKSYLHKTSNKKNIMDELKVLYKKYNIFETFDSVDPNIMGFKNGVYDFTTFKLRPALPEEYVSITTGYKYSEPDEDIKKFIYKTLEDILPNKEELAYVLKMLSTALIGDILLEQFYIWIGKGRNGKGLLSHLVMNTLGPYYDSMEIEYLCKSNQGVHANAADPIMAKKKNCRLVISTEPESDVVLRNAKLKQLSGKDPVQVRDLYKSSFSFIPKFNIIIQTNIEPTVDGTDGGIVGRLRLIKFPNIFVENPTEQNHRKIDTSLKSKINNEKHKVAFFSILVDNYKLFIKEGLNMPDRIKKHTEKYINKNNPVKQFITDKIEITKNKKDTIKSSKLYEMFREYDGDKSNISTTKFKSILESLNIYSKRSNDGVYFTNIKQKVEFGDT